MKDEVRLLAQRRNVVGGDRDRDGAKGKMHLLWRIRSVPSELTVRKGQEGLTCIKCMWRAQLVMSTGPNFTWKDLSIKSGDVTFYLELSHGADSRQQTHFKNVTSIALVENVCLNRTRWSTGSHGVVEVSDVNRWRMLLSLRPEYDAEKKRRKEKHWCPWTSAEVGVLARVATEPTWPTLPVFG